MAKSENSSAPVEHCRKEARDLSAGLAVIFAVLRNTGMGNT
jgi:hypothetical protein